MSRAFLKYDFAATRSSPRTVIDALTITGDLMIREATREIRLVVERERDGSLGKNAPKLVFKGHGSFARLNFGLRWHGEIEGGDLVAGDVVDVDLRITVRPGAK